MNETNFTNQKLLNINNEKTAKSKREQLQQ